MRRKYDVGPEQREVLQPEVAALLPCGPLLSGSTRQADIKALLSPEDRICGISRYPSQPQPISYPFLLNHYSYILSPRIRKPS